jgi:hypothetical protein
VTSAERAARERKQKIFVAVGGLFLVALLAIQLPRLLGGSSGTSAAPPTTTTTPGVSGAPTTTPATPTRSPSSFAPGDRPLAAGAGQLSSFAGFKGKDPFVQQVHFADSAASGGTATPEKAGAKGKKPESKAATKGFSVGQQPSASMTVISVNGARQTLVPGTRFPAADPVFVLVAEQQGSKSVVVGIAGGAYASGSRTAKLVIGKPLVLVNTTTGARYKLVLVAVGNGQSTTAPGTGTTPQSTKPTK